MDKNLKPVKVSIDSFEKIILHSYKYANSKIPDDEWKMVYGLLSGYSDDKFLYIKNAHPLTVGGRREVSIMDQDYLKIAEIDNNLQSEGKGHYIIGSYHSKPGLNLFMSYIDLINQLGKQIEFNDAITLVFDPTLFAKKKEDKSKSPIKVFDTGFEIYRLTDINLEPNSGSFDTNYHKIDYILEGLNKQFFKSLLAKLSALLDEL